MAGANASDDRASKLSAEVVDNDRKIKDGLKELEAIATQQGLAIFQPRNDVQEAVRDMAVVMQQQAAHGTDVSLLGAGAPGVTTEEMRYPAICSSRCLPP